MPSLTNVAALIPAYNPDRTLLEVIAGLTVEGFTTIIVVNDGSTAAHSPIFQDVEKIAGTQLLLHPENRGKGEALKTGLRHIQQTLPEIAYVVTVDADGQHLPKDVKKVAAALLDHPDALVLGTRDFTNAGIPWRSKFGNNLTARLFTSLSGTALQDTQTGLRGFGRAYLSKLILLPTSKYEFELDGLLLAVRDQMTIHQVKIETVYEPGNPTSHFNPLIDSMRIYWVLLRFCFGGITAYLTDLFFFTLLSSLETGLFGALVVGRLAGAGAGFMASKHIVFKDKNQKNRLINYAALWIALFIASYFLLDLLTKHLGLNIFMSRIIVDGSLFSLSFYVQKNFVFSSK